MKSLKDSILESLEINETLVDEYYQAFEFRSMETFSQRSWSKMLHDAGLQKDVWYAGVLDVNIEVCGEKYVRVCDQGNGSMLIGYTKNDEVGVVLIARMDDGRAYCNDEKFLAGCGLKTKKNPKFNASSYKQIAKIGFDVAKDKKYGK